MSRLCYYDYAMPLAATAGDAIASMEISVEIGLAYDGFQETRTPHKLKKVQKRGRRTNRRHYPSFTFIPQIQVFFSLVTTTTTTSWCAAQKRNSKSETFRT